MFLRGFWWERVDFIQLALGSLWCEYSMQVADGDDDVDGDNKIFFFIILFIFYYCDYDDNNDDDDDDDDGADKCNDDCDADNDSQSTWYMAFSLAYEVLFF